MGRRKTADITAHEFRFRLSLLAKAKGLTINKLHEVAGVQPRHTRDIVSRNKSPTFKLIRRLVEPQNITVAVFIGDRKTLATSRKRGANNGLGTSSEGA